MIHLARFCIALVMLTAIFYGGQAVLLFAPQFFLGYLALISAALLTYGIKIYEG